MTQKIILDLCGGTGSWGVPYAEAGYDVRLVTLPEHDVRTYEPPQGVYGILAAPPCTYFSMAGYRKNVQPDFRKGMEIVDACIRIIDRCDPVFHALENPIGHLSKFLGKPDYSFHPWWFGDPWVKRTSLWGQFNEPKKKYFAWGDVPKIDCLYIRPGRKKPSIAFSHKSAVKNIPQLQRFNPRTDAEFRAITPPGFARAFFEENR